MQQLTIGSPAPDFTLPGPDGAIVTLQQFRGAKVVLYFYPKDHTPGCSDQARAWKEAFADMQALGVVVVGISRDNTTSHAKFAAKLELPFLLLSDAEGDVCQLYQVIKEKNMYGKKFMGIERSTFMIDEQGILTHAFRKVKVRGHAEAVLAALQECST